MSAMQAGLGPHFMWGYTPARDLLEGISNSRDEEVNVLVCQPGDIGHVLKTICSRRKHPAQRINLYVWERQIEVLARHLLLLQVVHDWETPIRQRANTFLEIFGNCLVQERTSRRIASLGHELIHLVCDSSGALHGLADLSLLKFRERDMLERVFKSWDHGVPYDVANLRDHRLRAFYRERYDSRRNLGDWDYTSRVKDVAGIIHHKQYRGWRLQGIAYEFGDQVYNHPNRSMASYAEGIMVKGEHKGSKKEVRGFWVDIRAGPFYTFGVDCPRPNEYANGLFEIVNKGTGTEQWRHNTAEVAAFSVLSCLWELEAGSTYAMTRAHDVYSGLGEAEEGGKAVEVEEAEEGGKEGGGGKGGVKEEGAEGAGCKEGVGGGEQEGGGKRTGGVVEERTGQKEEERGSKEGEKEVKDEKGDRQEEEEEEKESGACASKEEEEALARMRCIKETLDGVKVYLLAGELEAHLPRARFSRFFHRVDLSSTAVQVAGSEAINGVLADEALVTADTAKYVIPLDKGQQQAFAEKVCTMAQERAWEPVSAGEPQANGGRPAATAASGTEVLGMNTLAFRFRREESGVAGAPSR